MKAEEEKKLSSINIEKEKAASALTAVSPPLNIVGFDDREQTHTKGVVLPDWMPKHEFFMLIVAPAGCGKTTLILNILLRIYKSYFNKILVFSPTIHNDQKWEHLTKTKKVLCPNPHAKLWEGKVKLKQVPMGGENGLEKNKQNEPFNDMNSKDEFEKMIAALKPETFSQLLGSSKQKRRKGMKKQHISEAWLKLWQESQSKKGEHAQSPHLPNPETILERYQRLQRLTNTINPPLDPELRRYARDFNTMLGIPASGLDIGGDDWTGVTGGSGGSGGGGRRANTGGNNMPFGVIPANDYLFGSSQQYMRRRLGFRVPNKASTSLDIYQKPTGSNSFLSRTVFPASTQSSSLKENEVQTQKEENTLGPSNTPTDEHQKKFKRHSACQVQQDCLFEDYSEETLQTIMENQDTIVRYLTDNGKQMTDADHMCIVFDDMVGSGLFNAKRNNAFKRLTVRRRHFCTSVIGVVQAYKEFPKTSRNNTNIYILFKIDSDEELVAIYRDFPCGLTWPVWRRVYDYCTREPYSFMMINLQVKDPKFRIIKNFDEPLNVPVYERQEQEAWSQQFCTSSSVQQ